MKQKLPRFLCTTLLITAFCLPGSSCLAQETPAPVERAYPPPPPPLSLQEEVFKVVPIMPRFPGCEHLATTEEKHKCADEKFLRFIYHNLRYPDAARERGIEGTVTARFFIEKDGSMREASIVNDIGGGCGEEVLRVLYLMKEHNIRWTAQPARGRPVAVEFTVPVTFPPQRE